MEYNFKTIDAKWQKYWIENKTYKVTENSDRPKYYVLDMFPYPSGAGLHVGHPLGYIASDIYSRFKRHKGFNVLHPMGYDAFGLPAEQYAIQTGQHPAVTTEQNIRRYREQLDKIGFSFDWDREVQTCDPEYYHWTQWAFIRMFDSYYCNDEKQARPVSELMAAFEQVGTQSLNVACSEELHFTPDEWKKKSEREQQEILLNYRIAYLSDTTVNWCPQLGTVLANDEVINGLSERGGYPVEQRLMRQWSLRVSAYAQRLLDGLDVINWTDSLKESQRNWIGRSEGAEMTFQVAGSDVGIEIFTTRADTIFGVTFMVLAPESDYVQQVTTDDRRAEVDAYLEATKRRTERDRLIDKKITGVFTGAYAVHPFNGKAIPIWISDYVLAGYGTGAIMAVPAHDSRDYAFARHFDLPVIPLIEDCDVSEESFDAKEGIMMNSGFLDGLTVKEAIEKARKYVEEHQLGRIKVNYRLRDAIFSRQRYWGEPFPVYYKEGLPCMLPLDKLPLELPEVDKYLPTETGEPPLKRAEKWAWDTINGKVTDISKIDHQTVFPLELNTMPGFAGSSAYYLRYMDPGNTQALVAEEKDGYWRNVDLYIGGTEHATGHLIYSRFWNKFLYDIGVSCEDEPFKKLINQGMIQGRSNFVYKILFILPKNKQVSFFISKKYYDEITNNILYPFLEKFPEWFEKLDEEIKKQLGETYLKDRGVDIEQYLNVLQLNRNQVPYTDFSQEDFVIDAKDLISQIELPFEPIVQRLHVDVNIVNNEILDLERFMEWRPEFETAEFILEDGKYICGWAVEKMSKSYHNVVNPDMVVEQYGADTLRMYEMFLGPLEQSKPWDTAGIEGVHRFLRKVWNLFVSREGALNVSDEEPTNQEYKALHKAIKKITADIEAFSFNTAVSAFMICANELQDLKCNQRKILEPFLILLSPFAPHLAEELWEAIGHRQSITGELYPVANEQYLQEHTFTYPISFNGKTRFTLELPVDMDAKTIEQTVLANENAQKWIEGKTPKKVIVIPKKIVNIVI